MNRKELITQIFTKKSFLSVGLDSDPVKIPQHLKDLEDPVFTFNKAIIEATLDHCVAYKPNIAFYESQGAGGWDCLKKTLELIPKSHFTIADAKRGDIGNTSHQYAKTFFHTYDFDAVTVAPYMGIDSVSPFLEYENKWVILLGLTSNKGSQDFQFIKDEKTGKYLFELVLERASKWGNPDNLMFVIGATHPKHIEGIRKIIPDSFLLIPGVGAQGGDLQSIMKYGMNEDGGMLINSSRGVIFKENGPDFAKAAGEAAQVLSEEMSMAFVGQGE